MSEGSGMTGAAEAGGDTAETTFTMNTSDGTRLHVYRWLPAGAPRAVVQIAHGMGEHAGRYRDTALALNAAGYAVYANDHRGHGRTADPSRLGWMGDNGWNGVIRDAAELSDYVRQHHPGLPVALVAHSMGAMMAQQYLYRHGARIDAAVLSGSPGFSGRFQALVSSLAARFERWRLGADADSPLLQKLLFGASNKSFDAPEASGFEWLSRDASQVRSYVDDPLCGFVLRAGSLCELFAGAKEAKDQENILQIPRHLPVLVLSGSDDPVHNGQRNLDRLLKAYGEHLSRVEYRIYPEGRHEMFNESNREVVVQDLAAWLEAVLPSPTAGSAAAASPN